MTQWLCPIIQLEQAGYVVHTSVGQVVDFAINSASRILRNFRIKQHPVLGLVKFRKSKSRELPGF